MREGTQIFMIVMIYYDLNFGGTCFMFVSGNIEFQISNQKILTNHDNHENLRSVPKTSYLRAVYG
jgi:hypothetical protein